MKIFNHFQHINLTNDQRNALEKLSAFLESEESIFILQGYAGSGKTTLLKGVVEYLNSLNKACELMAPTGRAAKILRDKTGQGRTIHSTIYNFEEMKTINADSDELAEHSIRYIFPIYLENINEKILIVDEASMVSSKESNHELFEFGSNVLLDDLLTYCFSTNRNNKIIFVGDPAQLAPVGDNDSLALSLEYFIQLGYKGQEAELTEVKRQEANLILDNATAIRDVLNKEKRAELKLVYDDKIFVELKNTDVAEKYVQLYPKPEIGDGVIISYSNSKCYQYNLGVRQALYPNNRNILPGDLILINNNNYHFYKTELYNGDIAKVIDVSKNIETLSAPVWSEKYGRKERLIISLDFRKIKIRVPQYSEEIECYIIETLLNSINRELTIEMSKALYINFVMRFTELQKENEKIGLKKDKVGSDVFKKALLKDPYFNAIRAKYGYAITCHKAQGGEWNKVFVDYSGRIGLYDDALRWSYTATTRAVKALYAVNPPCFTHFSQLKFSKVGSFSNIPINTLSFDNINVSPFHKVNDHKGKSLKYWDVREKLEDSAFEIENVASFGFLERYTLRDNQGHQYVIEANHRQSGHFIDTFKVQNSSNSDLELKLEEIFNQRVDIEFQIDYSPTIPHLQVLHSIMRQLCSELDISITNIDAQIDKYFVIYFLRTDNLCSYIQFYFRKNGTFSTAKPKTFQTEDDGKLNLLIEKLSNYAI